MTSRSRSEFAFPDVDRSAVPLGRGEQHTVIDGNRHDDGSDSREDRLGAPAVVMAFSILELLVRRTGPTRLAEVVHELAIPKTSALRVLRTLTGLGVIRRDPANGTYQIGSRLLDYAYAPNGLEAALVRGFHPIAEPLCQEFDETVQLAVLGGTEVTFIATVDSTRAVRLVTHVGRRLPAHATAVGKAILAYADPAVVQAVVDGGLPQVGPNTITDADQFLNALAQVRRDGYASESEESAANLTCYSAPVLDAAGGARAGITICVPTVKIPASRRRELAAAICQAAGELTVLIGGAADQTAEGA